MRSTLNAQARAEAAKIASHHARFIKIEAILRKSALVKKRPEHTIRNAQYNNVGCSNISCFYSIGTIVSLITLGKIFSCIAGLQIFRYKTQTKSHGHILAEKVEKERSVEKVSTISNGGP